MQAEPAGIAFPGRAWERGLQIEYIHDNPIRRSLVSRAVDWPSSSAQAWAGCEDALVSIDRTIPTMAEWLVSWP
jgi:hypothetical protein